MKINIKQLSPNALMRKGTEFSAGIDVAYSGTRSIKLWPHEVHDFQTGWAFELPKGIAMLVLPRSGLARKVGLRPVNTPGLVDPDYRGELIVALEYRKPDGEPVIHVNPGDFIAQVLFVPFYTPTFEIVSELSETERGSGGFGSTGVR